MTDPKPLSPRAVVATAADNLKKLRRAPDEIGEAEALALAELRDGQRREVGSLETSATTLLSLERGGLVEVVRVPISEDRRRRLCTVAITPKGLAAVEAYAEKLAKIVEETK